MEEIVTYDRNVQTLLFALVKDNFQSHVNR